MHITFYDDTASRMGTTDGTPPSVGERVWCGDWYVVTRREWFLNRSRIHQDELQQGAEVYMRLEAAP